MRMSDNKQKAMIHQLKKLLGLDNDVYKEMLFNSYGVTSSKDLTYKQATDFMTNLKKQAEQAGLWESKRSFQKYNYNNLEGREGMATPKQLRMMAAMWADYSNCETNEDREKAFRNFISKRFSVSDIKFIDVKTASKIIHALKIMTEQKKAV